MIDLTPYDYDKAFYRIIGRPPDTTMVGAGFMQKRMKSGVDWPGGVFNHFSASLVLRGSGRYVREDKTSIPLEPGSLFFRIPGIAHSTTFDPDSDWLEFFIAFRLHATNPQERGGHTQAPLGVLATQLLMVDPRSPVRSVRPDGLILERCEAYLERLKQGDRIETAAMDGLSLMVELLEHHPPEAQVDPVIDDICARLRDAAGSRTALPELCAGLPFSYARLRERFVARIGMSMGRYQLKYRMEMAARLLHEGASVKMVAAQLGYSDPFAFSKQFKQVMGMTPSANQQGFLDMT